MATIKVKFRPSGIQGKAGTLYFQVSHRRVIRQISTDLHILPQDWDDVRQRIVPSDSGKIRMQNRIDCSLSLLRLAVDKLESRGLPYQADDVVGQFKDSAGQTSILTFMREQIDYLYRCRKFGTAKNYERTLRSFGRFLDGDIAIIALNEQLVENYNAYLMQRGLVRNSISFYMRILRAVYNKAVRRQIVGAANPFWNVYTGIDKTRKRAVDEQVIARLCNLDLSRMPHLVLARDVFIFSYCARGMAFVDVAFLKKRDIRGMVLDYARHKTGQLLRIKLEPNMRKIIDKYANSVKETRYVFPFLTSFDMKEAYDQYRNAIGVYNRHLAELSRMLLLPYPLTSYSARHSWANAARKHKASLAVISAGLGHNSERTTQIYLTSLENSEIDAVNKGIIAKLYD